MATPSTDSQDSYHHDSENGLQGINQEKTTPNSSSDFEPAPDGGIRAWLVAVGAASIFFSCMGFSNAFGTFTQFYLSHQLSDQTPSNIGWIASISSFIQFFIGVIAGPLFDRYGAKVIRPAAVVYVFAMMMLSLCKTYWQIMLVQGILMGLAMGFLQFPAMAAVSQFFDKKRALALGVAMAGSSIGGIVMPIAVSKMLNGSSLGFGWTVRIIGFLVMPFMAFALFAIRTRLPPTTTSFWIAAAFKDRKLILLTISLFFVLIGIFMPIVFISTYAVSRGMEATLAGYLPAILNAASTFGRVVPGMLADKYGRLNIYAIGSILTGIVVFCMNSATSNAALIVFSAVFGFTSGTIISGATVSLTACAQDPRNIGTYMGMGIALGAFGGLIGPPIDGAFLDHYHGFFQAAMFSGAMCCFGGFVVLLAKLATPQGLLGRV